MKTKSPMLDAAMASMKRDHCIPKSAMKTNYESPLEHSSSPWSTGKNSALPGTVFCGSFDLIGFSTGRTNDEQDNANAAHIVLCVNSHEQLLAACKAVRDGWEKNLTEPMRLINEAIDAAEGQP